ncbi:MAG: hypothetical protein M3291_06145, partial [Actinomycetota bacterium]|nr:hypothetical protein [Actinomycetota bacterium]
MRGRRPQFLAQRHTVIVPDLRGIGCSSLERSGYDTSRTTVTPPPARGTRVWRALVARPGLRATQVNEVPCSNAVTRHTADGCGQPWLLDAGGTAHAEGAGVESGDAARRGR